MKLLRNKKTVVVHSGNFHADDVFAVAILAMYLGYLPKIFRTREEKIIKKADYVLDVGRVYNPKENKFDHHGEGWNEKRDNGVLYASAGLVWKEYGVKICASDEIINIIDEKVIQGIDANDNGMDLPKDSAMNIKAYSIFDYVYSQNPTWREDNNSDKVFKKIVKIAQGMMNREIVVAKDYIAGQKRVLDIYNKSKDKRILVLDKNYNYAKVVEDLSEVLLIIKPEFVSGNWHINTVSIKGTLFQARMDLPAKWAGKYEVELQKITGIKEVIFCHNRRFISVCKTRESAIKLAQLALKEINNK